MDGRETGEMMKPADAATEARCRELVRQEGWSHCQEFLRLLPVGVQEIDVQGRLLLVNRAYCAIYGFTEEELIGTNCVELVAHEADRNAVREYWVRLVREQPAPTPYTGVCRRKDGALVDVQVDWNYKRDGAGRVTGFVGIVTDITAKRRAETALREAECEKDAILSSLKALRMKYLDPDFRIKWATPTVAQEIGRDLPEIVGSFCHQALHGRATPCPCCPVIKAFATGEPQDAEIQPNEEKVLLSHSNPVKDAAGVVTGVVHVTMDITERKRVEEALQLTQFSVDHASIATFWVTPEGRIRRVNRAACALLGFSAGELLSMSVSDLNPDYTQESWAVFFSNLKQAGSISFEHALRTRDGRLHPVEISSDYFEYEGQAYCFFNVLDVSARKAAEQARLESERRLREMMDNVQLIAVMLEDQGNITFINDYLLRLTGWRREEVTGLNWMEVFIPPEAREEVKSVYRTVVQAQSIPAHYENPIMTRQGERRLVAWDNTMLRDHEGRVIGVASLGRDITEQRQLEEQLRQTQKMEAIGQLAGGIAHDFNNLLTGILGYANMIRLEPQATPEILDAAGTIEKAAERAAELTGKLLGFARRGKFLSTPVNIGEIVREVLGLLSRTVDKKIVLTQYNRAAHACVLGDPGQIQQVILNLALNARDAMAEGGKLTIATTLEHLGDSRIHINARPGQYVVIAVSDTGCGIPSEIRQRIFEPFFTTKEPGKGTGMGLAMAYGIVNNHGGFITVESEPGKGSTFKVFLPYHVEGDGVQPAEVALAARQGSGTILLVDDEEVVLNVSAQMLRRLGYTVFTARGGYAALELYRGQSGVIDLAIIDMVMPGMDGRETFLALRAINPDLRAILSSGYGIDGRAQESVDLGMAGFIQKPYRLEDLFEIVNRVQRAPGA